MTEPAGVDGRHMRREQNREQVLDALGELFAEGVLTPTTRQIAERVGLSMRSLVRYFDDFDDLVRAAILREERLALPLLELEIDPHRPTTERIASLVEARVSLFEAIAPSARAGRAIAHRQSIIQEEMARSRTFLRRQVVRALAPELEGASRDAIAAIDVLLSFESYELLRGAQRLSRAKVADVLVKAVENLLQGDRVYP